MSKFEIPFINLCIREFSKRFCMSLPAAYEYLSRHEGIAFLEEFYDVEHLQSIDETIDDLIVCCRNKGGYLV